MSYYNYGGWKPYVSVAERRRKAEKVAAKATGAALSPVSASRGAIAKTFWGRAWCDNLERYSDYSNRLPRGRTYVRNGSVIDLQIGAGEVHAQVVGSSLYKVAVSVAAVPDAQWRAISADCAASIDSLVELLQGRLSKAVMERICRPGTGLFPAPREIKLSCSCPDWAEMCKHVAAVLYGVGARLDQTPELLFQLRRVDAKELVAQAGAAIPVSGKGPAAAKVLDTTQLGDVFGIEIDAALPPPAAQRAAPRKTAAPGKPAASKRDAAVPKKLVTAPKQVAVVPKKLVTAPKRVAVVRKKKAAAEATTAAPRKGAAGKLATAAKTAAASNKPPNAGRKSPTGKAAATPAGTRAAKSIKPVKPAKRPGTGRRG